jgi:hypothetical protein
MGEWMTIAEAAERYGIPADTIRRRLNRRRHWPREWARKSGRTWLVSDDAMAALWADDTEEE